MRETEYGRVYYLRFKPDGTAQHSLGYPDEREPDGATLLFARWVRRSRFAETSREVAARRYVPHRNALLDYVIGNRGTPLKTADDSVLAYFERPAQAVQAAVHAQRALESLNHEGHEQIPAVQAQVGIHTARIALQPDGPRGDEVGVAARLAALAVPEGICVSKSVYDATRNDWHMETRHLGLFQAEDLAREIRVYLLKPTGITWRDKCHYWLRSACPKLLPRSSAEAMEPSGGPSPSAS